MNRESGERVTKVTIYQGESLASLQRLPDASVDCVVTSPPYWLQRDYGFAEQIGQEPDVNDFVGKLVTVFAEVYRVLKSSGVCWVNLGDTYHEGRLMGVPWRVAFAMESTGWILRQDVIWHKPNPMPEPVMSRCVKAHEYVFLFSKSRKYFFDHKAIAEPSVKKTSGNLQRKSAAQRGIGKFDNGTTSGDVAGSVPWSGETRNKRSVWTIAGQSVEGAHFATMPESLAEICIKAGCPESGCVLDPFAGTGTTGYMAFTQGKNSVLCEGNPEYVDMIKGRFTNNMFAEVKPSNDENLSLLQPT